MKHKRSESTRERRIALYKSDQQSSVRLVVYSVLGVHAKVSLALLNYYGSQTTICRVCTEIICNLPLKRKESVLGSGLALSSDRRWKKQWPSECCAVKAAPNAELFRNVWRKLRFLSQRITRSLERPLCLPVQDLPNSQLICWSYSC